MHVFKDVLVLIRPLKSSASATKQNVDVKIHINLNQITQWLNNGRKTRGCVKIRLNSDFRYHLKVKQRSKSNEGVELCFLSILFNPFPYNDTF